MVLQSVVFNNNNNNNNNATIIRGELKHALLPHEHTRPTNNALHVGNITFDSKTLRHLIHCLLNDHKSLGKNQDKELSRASSFFVKVSMQYCNKMHHCNFVNCKFKHVYSQDLVEEYLELQQYFYKHLFYNPAVRQGLIPDSLVQEHLNHLLYKEQDMVDIYFKQFAMSLRKLTSTTRHEYGYQFNPWAFAKSDITNFYFPSVVHHFLCMYMGILKNDHKLKCSYAKCVDVACIKTHFDITPIDQLGSFKSMLKILYKEAHLKWNIFSQQDYVIQISGLLRQVSTDFQSCISIISQFSSLLILASLSKDIQKEILLAIQSFGEHYTSNVARPIWTMEILDEGRLLQACFSHYEDENSQTHRFLTVSQYGCSIGEAYMSKLFQVFAKNIQERFSTNLPDCIPRHLYDKLNDFNNNQKMIYTMPMHLWLLKTVSARNIATELAELQVRGFKSIDKGMATIEGWKALALEAVSARNLKWLNHMKIPDQQDMRSACEDMMPKWIKGFGLLIKKKSNPNPNNSNLVKSMENAKKRWKLEYEILENLANKEDEVTDWRKFCRLIRDYEMNAQESKASALWNYLLQASHRLKHTDYLCFDGELFLFLVKYLLHLYASRAKSRALYFMNLELQGNHRHSGTIMNYYLRKGMQMNEEEAKDVQDALNVLAQEINEFLPFKGKYLVKWALVLDIDFESLRL